MLLFWRICIAWGSGGLWWIYRWWWCQQLFTFADTFLHSKFAVSVWSRVKVDIFIRLKLNILLTIHALRKYLMKKWRSNKRTRSRAPVSCALHKPLCPLQWAVKVRSAQNNRVGQSPDRQAQGQTRIWTGESVVWRAGQTWKLDRLDRHTSESKKKNNVFGFGGRIKGPDTLVSDAADIFPPLWISFSSSFFLTGEEVNISFWRPSTKSSFSVRERERESEKEREWFFFFYSPYSPVRR